MIGVKKRIIVFSVGEMIVPMINPIITDKNFMKRKNVVCHNWI